MGGGFRRPERKKSQGWRASGVALAPWDYRLCPQALPLQLLYPGLCRIPHHPSPRPNTQPFRIPKSWSGQCRHFQFQAVLSLVRKEVQDANSTLKGIRGQSVTALPLWGPPRAVGPRLLWELRVCQTPTCNQPPDLHGISTMTRAVVCI